MCVDLGLFKVKFELSNGKSTIWGIYRKHVFIVW